jgi:hypothetical protein
MTARDPEREVANAMEQLRKADEASAPSFQATLTSARAGRESRRPAIGAVLAVATLLVVVVGLAVFESKHPPASGRPVPAPSSAKASVASWESPTAFLLETPGSALWRGLPRLTEPLPANLPADSPSSKKGVPS